MAKCMFLKSIKLAVLITDGWKKKDSINDICNITVLYILQ